MRVLSNSNSASKLVVDIHDWLTQEELHIYRTVVVVDDDVIDVVVDNNEDDDVDDDDREAKREKEVYSRTKDFENETRFNGGRLW